MRYQVSVIPNAKENKVEAIDDQTLKVRTTAKPKNNEANQAVISLLAKYFHVPKNCLKIKSGSSSKYKIIEVC